MTARPSADPSVTSREEAPTDAVLAEMRRLAEAATVGPWKWDGYRLVTHGRPGHYQEIISPVSGAVYSEYSSDPASIEVTADDIAYIAAVHPQAVLAILDALAAARERVAALEAESASEQPKHWTCFHCGEDFTDWKEAGRHFGYRIDEKPAACVAELVAARGLLSAWRYAKAFAGAEAWDGGHDMKQRFDLIDSVTELSGIKAAETWDEFRAHLPQARAAEEGCDG